MERADFYAGIRKPRTRAAAGTSGIFPLVPAAVRMHGILYIIPYSSAALAAISFSCTSDGACSYLANLYS